MIWFVCKQCAKTHGRAESQSGTLIFCDCGQGIRVPWSSTAAEPEQPPAPTPQALPEPARQGRESERFPDVSLRWRGGRQPVRTDPTRCLNHHEKERAATCETCREAFCAACVTVLEGRTLCGPCKDFRVRAVRQPAQMSALAIVSCVMSLVVAGPVSFCMPMTIVTTQAAGTMVPEVAIPFGLVALALPVTALILGLMALRNIESKPNVGGRAIALTGTIAASVGILWCIVVFAAVASKSGAG